MIGPKHIVFPGILLACIPGCSDSTLADCDKVATDGEVAVFGSSAPEFSWEGGLADEILVARTGDGVEVWNVYVDSDDSLIQNQIASPVEFGVLPDVGEDVELVEAVSAGTLEIGVEYQVQVFIQCDGGGAEDQIGTWSVDEE